MCSFGKRTGFIKNDGGNKLGFSGSIGCRYFNFRFNPTAFEHATVTMRSNENTKMNIAATATPPA
jgi:hypothetical protein